MTPQPMESQAVSRVADDYRRRGYDVSVNPTGSELPSFLAGYQPDIIARRGRESVVVEVKVGTKTSVAERFRELAEQISRQLGWRFSLVYVNPSEPDLVMDADPAPLSELEGRAGEADSLLAKNQLEAAFLLYWSTLEGGLRLLGRRAQLPLENLPSSALIRELYSSGELSLEEFDTLMRFLPTRNKLVHGLAGRTDRATLEQLRGIVATLLVNAQSAT